VEIGFILLVSLFSPFLFVFLLFLSLHLSGFASTKEKKKGKKKKERKKRRQHWTTRKEQRQRHREGDLLMTHKMLMNSQTPIHTITIPHTKMVTCIVGVTHPPTSPFPSTLSRARYQPRHHSHFHYFFQRQSPQPLITRLFQLPLPNTKQKTNRHPPLPPLSCLARPPFVCALLFFSSLPFLLLSLLHHLLL